MERAMDHSNIIKEVGRGKSHARDLDITQAYELYRDILAQQVSALQLGALLIAFRIKGEAASEMQGFYQAVQQVVMPLQAPANRPMPVVIPSYNGARKQANLTPLLALLLAKFGLPVVVHGVTDDPGRVTSREIFQALGIEPVSSMQQAQQQIDDASLPVFIPISVLCPAIEQQLQLRWQLGVRNSSHTLAKLITPFPESAALRLSAVSHPEYVTRVGQFFTTTGGNALLLQGCEGEVYANVQRSPQIHWLHAGQQQVLVPRADYQPCSLPSSKSASDTASWIQGCLSGDNPLPEAVLTQLAACLVACQQANDIPSAKQLIEQQLATFATPTAPRL
jgi:anthranilate phosphoribosyltransferase